MNKASLSKIKLTPRDRLAFFSDLATMLTAGIPILETIDSLKNDSKGNLKKVLNEVQNRLSNGQTLSSGLESMPSAFDQVNVNLIKAAETGGTLEATLHDVVKATRQEIEFNEQLRATMIYPAFVMMVFLGILIVMLSFVIPRVAKVFSSLNVKMPEITKIMIKASNVFNGHWLIILVALAGLITATTYFVKANTRLVTKWVFALPSFRKLGINIDLSRFCRSFSLLLHSGVPILDALDLSSKVVSTSALEEVINQMKIDVAGGNSLSLNLKQKKSGVPPIMTRSLKTAERAGTLTVTLQTLSEYFDDQVAQSLKVLSSLIEPILIIFVGILVGSLMVAIIAPIYSMISQINATPK